MPASTSETAEIVGSSTSVDSTFSERMALIGSSPVSRVYRARIPPHDESKVTASVPPILTASRPICGNARSFPGRAWSGGGYGSGLGRDPRQMNRTAERLLHQIDAIEEHAETAQLAVPELGEVGDPQADRLVHVQHRERIAQHRRRLVRAQHDRLAVEAVDPEVIRDVSDHLEHGGLAAARAEKRKHVDRAMDRPIDLLVDQGFDVFELAFVDRAKRSIGRSMARST